MVNQARLVGQLRALGVASSAPLMVHASLRKLGPVTGGADALLRALVEVLSPGGTLVMVLGASVTQPFDRLTSPADEEMGALAEFFRTWPGVEVNDHAAARYAAHGPASHALLEATPLNDYHGPGSVLDRLQQRGGSVLRLGADPDTLTLTHLAEYLAQVPSKRRVRRRYLRADSGEQWVDSLDDNDGICEWAKGDYFPQVLLDFLAAGHAQTGVVGACAAELVPARAFVTFATAWMEAELS